MRLLHIELICKCMGMCTLCRSFYLMYIYVTLSPYAAYEGKVPAFTITHALVFGLSLHLRCMHPGAELAGGSGGLDSLPRPGSLTGFVQIRGFFCGNRVGVPPPPREVLNYSLSHFYLLEAGLGLQVL